MRASEGPVTGDEVAAYYLRCFLPLCAALVKLEKVKSKAKEEEKGEAGSEVDGEDAPAEDGEGKEEDAEMKPAVDEDGAEDLAPGGGRVEPAETVAFVDPSKTVQEHDGQAKLLALRFLRRQQVGAVLARVMVAAALDTTAPRDVLACWLCPAPCFASRCCARCASCWRGVPRR